MYNGIILLLYKLFNCLLFSSSVWMFYIHISACYLFCFCLPATWHFTVYSHHVLATQTPSDMHPDIQMLPPTSHATNNTGGKQKKFTHAYIWTGMRIFSSIKQNFYLSSMHIYNLPKYHQVALQNGYINLYSHQQGRGVPHLHIAVCTWIPPSFLDFGQFIGKLVFNCSFNLNFINL